MGKNLRYGNLVTRPKKLAFYGVPNRGYQRMEGFTDLGYSQNPKEYSRQYVDEDFERTDIVGYSPSISYSFDRYTNNEVLADIVKITENEYIGDLMKRTIVTVDLSNGNTTTAPAKMRDYAVIPDTNGDTTDCLTYSGNFKTKGFLIDCIATSTDDWQTIKITQNIERSVSANISVTGDGVRNLITDNGSTHVMGEVTKDTDVTISVVTDFAGAVISLYRISKSTSEEGAMGLFYPIKTASGVGHLENAGNRISSDSTYAVTVEAGEKSAYYTIDLTAVEPVVQTASEISTMSMKSKKTTAKE
ncbi:MAG: hypothetical protein K2J39_06280 [Ruminococcus sp.]|nr:hypothetical protein [Ruminococcus sp.]